MALKTTVKVSGVNNLSNARYCAGMGVEMLGFDMDTLPIEQFNEIKNWIAGVKIVGETKSLNISEILDKIDLYKPDLIEIDDWDLASELIQKSDIDVILKETNVKTSIKYPENVKYLNFEVFTEKALNEYFTYAGEPFLLISNQNLTKQNIALQGEKFGISIHADHEERPGFSNFENTMEALESLESED